MKGTRSLTFAILSAAIATCCGRRAPPAQVEAPLAAAALTAATALPAYASSSASLDNFIGSLVAGGLLFAVICGAVIFVSTFDQVQRR